MSPRPDYASEAALDQLLAPPFDRFRRLNTFRMFAHAPHVSRAWLGVTQAIMGGGLALPAALREAAILQVARARDCAYMAVQHRRLAKSVGLDQAAVAAIDDDAPSPDDPDVDLVRRAAHEAASTGRVGSQTFEAAIARFGERAAMELLIVIAHYLAGSVFLNTTGVEPED